MTTLTYRHYLQLDKILDAQAPISLQQGTAIHDEMLFITVHQVYELWFKQILHEMDSILSIFSQQTLNDTVLLRIVARLQRITKIQHLMIDQVKILETMTPMDFLEFRDLLGQASGLQSYQFRLLEMKLGVPYDINKIPFFASLDANTQEAFAQTATKPTLLTLVEKWLERTPFLITDDFSFWDNYKHAVEVMLKQDKQKIENETALSSSEKESRLLQHQQTEKQFQSLYDDAIYNEYVTAGDRRISRIANTDR